MSSRAGPPLDEIQWHGPAPQGIHSNSVLWYFADSPFFDPTSNNAVIINQGLSNQSMQSLLETRAAFEGRLKSMSGLEFIVAQEPAETAPGTGTGIWVIRKQTRRKRPGMEDEITVHATYFIVGDNIYMAPTLVDILSSRVATISSALSKTFSAAGSVQKWSPALGRVYESSAASSTLAATRAKGIESNEDTNKIALDSRLAALAEESLGTQLKHGGEYMDENPIIGQPGAFTLSSTGRKDKLAMPLLGKQAPLSLKDTPLPLLNTKTTAENPLARSAKDTKSPKTPTMSKPKRRKSKGGTSTPAPTTPS